MRHKTPQLVAQHCFVASFCRCFPFFTLRDKLVAQQNHLLRVEASCCWKVERGSTSFFIKLKLVAQQIARALANQPISAPHFFTRNKVKNAKHRRKLATKQCCTTSWGFLYLVFRRLKTYSRSGYDFVTDAVVEEPYPPVVSRLTVSRHFLKEKLANYILIVN